jgi:ubiquinone biosynthesis protein
MSLRQTLQHLNRLREVVQVLLKHGFGDVVFQSSLRFVLPHRNTQEFFTTTQPKERWAKLRMVVEELGSTFIKFAQLLSNRPDLLPETLIQEFEKLQNDANPIHYDLIQKTIFQETQKKVEDIFSFFDKKAIGVASIGQVHKAKLKNGSDVVVKIQRPNVSKQLEVDLGLLREFIRLTENYFKKIGILNPLEVLEAFEESMQAEMDYMREAKHLEQFRKCYANHPDFSIPMPYRNLCTKKMLVMEYMSGCKITDIPQMEAWGINPEKMVEKGMEVYLSQIFDNGFFHADPHPGNILVRPTGKLVLLDFGMVGKLTQFQKYAFAGVFVGLANQDSRSMALNLRKLSPESDFDNVQALEQDLEELIENFIVLDVDNAGLSECTAQLQKIIYKHKLQVHGVVFLILRALAIIEGIGRTLHPNFQALEFIKPYGIKLMAEQFSFKNQRNEIFYSMSQLISLLYVFPSEIKQILKQLRNGQLKISHNIEHLDLIPKQLERNSKRIHLSILASVSIIASILFMLTPFASNMPLWWGLPYLSTFGLMLGGVLGIFGFFRK